MNNQNNLLFSAIFFIAGGALLLSPGVFPSFLTTNTWMIAYLLFFLFSVNLGIRYIKKAPTADQEKFFIFHPLTITTFLAYLLVLASSVVLVVNMVALFSITL